MSKLKCVMYCEFDPHLGPQIAFQEPPDFISKEKMDKIASYIITKPKLQGRLMSLKSFGFKFMGFPVVIENKKYHRNALIFNTVFVFEQKEETSEFEPVVEKLAGYLKTIELEKEYLSQEETKKNILEILKRILNDLNVNGECTIPINDCNTVYLKVVNLPHIAPLASDHEVPLFLWSKETIEAQHWDLAARRILPYIDGFNHVQKIALLSDVDLSLVRCAIQTLLFHGVLVLIPIFSYSNMYAVKPEIHNLSKNIDMQNECIRYVALDENKLPYFRNIFMLYCALGSGISVNALCSRHNTQALGIDEQKLIKYGLVHKFVHKLNKYPVLLTSDHRSKWKLNSKFLNGYYNYEEISCKSTATGETIGYVDINKMTDNDPYVVHIWK